MRRKPRTPDELEQVTGIERSVPRSLTRADISKLERKILGLAEVTKERFALSPPTGGSP